jgi:hypothetical protein
LPPPPPTPMTLILGPLGLLSSNSIISKLREV